MRRRDLQRAVQALTGTRTLGETGLCDAFDVETRDRNRRWLDDPNVVGLGVGYKRRVPDVLGALHSSSSCDGNCQRIR
jgi:hypothetical protein